MRIIPKSIKMIRFAFYIFVLISLVATGACTSRNTKIESRNLIPEEELVSVLTDSYIAGGLLSLPEIRHLFSSLDSIDAYYKVIESHGYTKETMDKTIKYYFIKNPKKLISIYDQVLGILSEMESRIAKEVLLEASRIDNLWSGEESYFFQGTSDSVWFDIPLTRSGNYMFSFTITLFPDDQTLNPHFDAYSCRTDSLETGKKHYLKVPAFIKDGRPHTYTITIPVPENTTMHFKGILFDNLMDTLEKHLLIEKITLVYISMAVV